MTKAIYAGSFDPLTNGHLWVIDKATEIFDEVCVAIGDNASKSYTFTQQERLHMLGKSLSKYKNVTISSFSGQYLVKYAKEINAQYIIRGIRNHSDYDFEKMLKNVNHDLEPSIETIYLIPPRHYIEISSSLVKGLVGPAGWQDAINKYVPPIVLQYLNKLNNSHE